ncbi:MAG: IS1 family transposase, partial [Cytophagales bacterium]|nr:IS1 family transposase [Cytophagales bacterium]
MKLTIEWKSKIIDLLIVIIGISVAFKLNAWNESIKAEDEARNYIESFYDENVANEVRLDAALRFAEENKKSIDTLEQILQSKNYADSRIRNLTLKMLGEVSFSPSTTTMENVTASGEFKFIKDVELRKQIISTYNSFDMTLKLEGLLRDHVNNYLSPFLFENIRFTDFNSSDVNFARNPLFENVVFVYGILLSQQIRGYQNTLEKIKLLDDRLIVTKNSNSDNDPNIDFLALPTKYSFLILQKNAMNCPKCSSSAGIKSGKIKGKQRYKCKKCS